MKWVNTE